MPRPTPSDTESILTLSYVTLAAMAVALLLASLLVENKLLHDFTFHLSIAFFGATAIFFLIEKVLLRRNQAILATLERTAERLEGKLHFLRPISENRPFSEQLERGNEVCILGNTLTRLLPTYERAIRQFLDRGGSLRVLVLDPNGEGCRFLAFHSGRNVKAALESMLPLATSLSAHIKATQRGEFELRVNDWPASCGMYLVDPSSSGGYIRVTLYPPDIASPLANRPHFILKADSDQPWYDIFREQFETMWKAGRPLA